MTLIVWNGCDGYVEADEAVSRGDDFDGGTLFYGAQSFKAFEATEVKLADLPVDDDGEPDMNGVLVSETGKFYR